MKRRYLTVGEVVALDSGLWLVDVHQPVAVVLDRTSGKLLHTVSWSDVPPPVRQDIWPERRLVGDGGGLWSQESGAGLLVRLTVEGVGAVAWVDDLILWACHPGVAWCGPSPPRQTLLYGADQRPFTPVDYSRVLRVDADGDVTTVQMRHAVRSMRSVTDGLLVEVDDDPWRRRHLGGDTYEVIRDTRWLRLALDAAIPAWMSIETHGLPPSFVPPEPVLEAPSITRFGGTVVPVARPGVLVHGAEPLVDVVAVGATSDAVHVLLDAEQVDITPSCWPLIARPLETASYEQQVLAAHRDLGRDATDEVSADSSWRDVHDLRTRLVDEWPDTMLEWTFSWQRMPGLRLRRRIRLYDELGRLEPPEYAAVLLDETLYGGSIPSAAAAVDGILDI